MSKTEIYLDNASTTRMDPLVVDAWVSASSMPLGNASSVHRLGVKAATQIEIAREQIAARIGAVAEEIVFTSSGTESNHLAIEGYCRMHRERGDHLVVSTIEHPSVLELAKRMERDGFRVSYLSCDLDGRIAPESLRKVLTSKTLLASVMHANNEVGTIQDIEALARICNDAKVAFHTDACQSFTKVSLDVRKTPITLATLSAHKIHGPRGIAALFVRKGTKLRPVLVGGGQESGLRAGTYATEAIMAFGVAARIAQDTDGERMSGLRDELIRRVLERIPSSRLNGPTSGRLCNNANFFFDGVSSKNLLFGLDKKGIFVSVGSACASGKKTPSHVLLAMGRSEEVASETIRVTLSKWTTSEEIRIFVDCLTELVAQERKERP